MMDCYDPQKLVALLDKKDTIDRNGSIGVSDVVLRLEMTSE